MLPNRCSIVYNGRQCTNPPGFVVSVAGVDGDYMVGVACGTHKDTVSGKISLLQGQGRIPAGAVRFAPLQAVGTDCIRADESDACGASDIIPETRLQTVPRKP